MRPRLSPDRREAYSFSELDINAGDSPAIVQRVEQNPTEMHAHSDFAEAVLILEGSCEHSVSTGESYRSGAGDFFFIPKGTSHKYSDVESLKLVNVLVRTQFLEDLLSKLSALPSSGLFMAPEGSFARTQPMTKEKLSSCLELAGRIEAETWEGGEDRDLMLKALLTELFLKLIRCAASPESSGLRACPDFGKLAQYMEEHVQRSASIAGMAKAGGVSKRTLLRKFKAQTGVSPMERLTQMRLSKACRLLRESSMEIKSVAIACGFPDSNYFSRQYKKRLGVSPRQFRSSHTMTRIPSAVSPKAP